MDAGNEPQAQAADPHLDPRAGERGEPQDPALHGGYFELDLGSFEAAEILELFTREIAPHYYNRAIFDVQAHLKERFESIESDLWALEKN